MTAPSMARNNPHATATDCARLQWANGRTEGRERGSSRWSSWVGFYIEVGVDEELDRELHNAGVPRCEIRHPREGGAPAVTTNWDLGTELRFWPVTAGPVAPTVARSVGRNARRTAEAGIGLRWVQGERSRMAVRGFFAFRRGETWRPVPILVQLVARSKATDVLLSALVDHIRVCEVADNLIDRERHPDPVYLHEVALPLTADGEVTWGKEATTTLTPFKCGHPAEVTRDYIVSLWRPAVIHNAALAAWEGVVEWAFEYASGPEGQSDAA